MEERIDIINLDDSYRQQDFYRKFDYRLIDLADWRGVNYLCDYGKLNRLERRLGGLGPASLKYYGSGNFHYLSLIFLKEIREDFSLVLFDQHVEMLALNYGGMVSCGSWLLDLLRANDHLKQVYLLGVDRDYARLVPRAYLDSGRVRIITGQDLGVQGRVDLSGARGRIYISIDKDVFSREEARTNWDQGSLTLRGFKEVLGQLEGSCLLGADLCGEERYPSRDLMNPMVDLEIQMNNRLNYEIIKEIFRKF